MSVDAVLFDLDGTLVEYERPPGEVLDAAFERAGVEPFFPVEEYYARFTEFAGGEGVGDLRERCFAAIAEERGRDPALGREVAAAYTEERDPGRVRLLDGAAEAVAALAGEYDLGIVTNGPPDYQRPKLRATGLEEPFDTVVFAGFETAPKPDPEPFERALSALGAAPSRGVHVGNSVDADVAGAAAAGLRSVWIADGSEPDPSPDYAVDSPADLSSPPWD